MPKIEVEGRGAFEAEVGRKLVLVLEDHGVDVLHRCGGVVKCTTCRVEILEGDAGPMSEAEHAKLTEKGHDPNLYRLSCQIRVQGDLKLRQVMSVAASGLEAGPRPAE